MSLASPGRLERILQHYRGALAVCLQGTAMKCWDHDIAERRVGIFCR